jgi:Spy/CpxP family protein refolding chaperone
LDERYVLVWACGSATTKYRFQEIEGSLEMKTKLFFSILLFATTVPAVLEARDHGETNVHAGSVQLPVTAVEHSASSNVQTDPGVLANDPKQALQDYDSVMVAITQRFSATLAAIAEAVKHGDLSSDQAREMSGQQYELAQMQFELVSLWREIEQQDSAKIPDVHASPDPRHENEVVVVELPFASLQTNPALAQDLNLTQPQFKEIQQLTMQERKYLEPLVTELRITRDKLLTISSEHADEKEIKSLAAMEASVLAKLIVSNARMQSKIYKILSAEQQKKINELERTQGTGHDAR